MGRVSASEEPLAFTASERKAVGIPDAVARRLRADCGFFMHKVLNVEGDAWQQKFWGAMSGEHIEPFAKRMLALKACKGPGKTFAMAAAAWWWLFTRWHSNGVAMSITSDNLRDNLWAELARLQGRSTLLSHFFSHRGERIEAKEYPKDWWLSFRSFPQNADKSQQANTLAGLHGRHPLVLCDEVGDYPDGVVVAAEAVLATLVNGKPPDGRIILAGNPTSTEGPLYRVTMRDRARWFVQEITSDPKDPLRSPRVDPEWVQAQIDTWGIDSDFVKVNILGQFPSQQANKLIGPDTVQTAAARKIEPGFQQDALVFGLDVARYGDNASVLFQRQGNMSWRPKVWRELDLMSLADQVATEFVTKNPAALFVDQSGVGGGIVDRLRQMGIPVLAIDFGGAPLDNRFADRRSEMYWKMADWLKRGGTIPDDVALRQELVSPNYSWKATGKITKFKLESKDEMKKRGVSSPDMADALALTFAAPVVTPAKDQVMYSAPQMGSNNGWGSNRLRGGTEESWDPYGSD